MFSTNTREVNGISDDDYDRCCMLCRLDADDAMTLTRSFMIIYFLHRTQDPENPNTESYSDMRARWTREANADLQDNMFWWRLKSFNTSRLPLDRFQYWLDQEDDDPDESSHPKVVSLVVLRQAHTMQLWENLLDDHHLGENWPFINDLDGPEPLATVTAHMVLESLSLNADFFRAIVIKCRHYPCLLFWVVWSKPHIECPHRKEFADDFLHTPIDAIGDQSSVKIRILFHRELVQASIDGTLDENLYNVVITLARGWALDTKAVEGANNTIKQHVRLAPGIQWDLLNARFVGHKATVHCKKDRHACDRLLQRCLDNHEDTVKYMNSDVGKRRFDVVTKSSFPPAAGLFAEKPDNDNTKPGETDSESDPCLRIPSSESENEDEHAAAPEPDSSVSPFIFKKDKKEYNIDELCGAKLVLRIKREYALWDYPWEISVTSALRFTFEGASERSLMEVEERGNVWLYVHKYGQSQCWMARAHEFHNSSDQDENIIILQKPLEYRPILHVLSSIHRVILAEEDGTCTEDLLVDRLQLRWSLGSVTKAEIVNAQFICCLSQTCRSPLAKRTPDTYVCIYIYIYILYIHICMSYTPFI